MSQRRNEVHHFASSPASTSAEVMMGRVTRARMDPDDDSQWDDRKSPYTPTPLPQPQPRGPEPDKK